MKEVNSTTPKNASDSRFCSYRRQTMWAEYGLQELERTNCNYLKYRLFYDAISTAGYDDETSRRGIKTFWME